MNPAMNKGSESIKQLNDNPFDLANDEAYKKWRQIKLAAYPASLDELIVPIADVNAVTDDELRQLKQVIHRYNLVIYDLGAEGFVSKAQIRQFARVLDLDRIDNNICSDEDSITALQVSDAGQKKIYIPYTNFFYQRVGDFDGLDK